MNCYYSNLIEGHDTHPTDIERALKNDYSNDPRKRDLQLVAKAHITGLVYFTHLVGEYDGHSFIRGVDRCLALKIDC